MSDPRSLLGGYMTGTLTREELETLMKAAAADNELFEEIAESEDLRIAFSDPMFRARASARLRASDRKTESLLDRLNALLRPRWLVATSAIAALSVIVLIQQGHISQDSPAARVFLGPGTIPALRAAGIVETPGEPERRLENESRTEPPKTASGADLNLDRAGSNPIYRLGDRQRVGFQVTERASVLLLEVRSDGSMVRLYPNRFQSSPTVEPGDTILIPPSGQGDLTVEGPTGERTLRLLLFPPNVDPLVPGTEWDRVRDQARIREHHYTVEP